MGVHLGCDLGCAMWEAMYVAVFLTQSERGREGESGKGGAIYFSIVSSMVFSIALVFVFVLLSILLQYRFIIALAFFEHLLSIA